MRPEGRPASMLHTLSPPVSSGRTACRAPALRVVACAVLIACLALAVTTAAPAAGAVRKSPTTNLAKKPVIPKQRGRPPTQLVKQDIVKGTGRLAVRGDAVSVRYVGALWPSARQFDNNWGRGDGLFGFTLGAGMVIKGFDRGVLGMRVGGRRQVTMPPRLAYGKNGQGSIPANATLIFVIDLVEP